MGYIYEYISFLSDFFLNLVEVFIRYNLCSRLQSGGTTLWGWLEERTDHEQPTLGGK